jgi:mRNA-degrading endonuclease toxin of MazEF toxin-antitoxin module
MPSRGEVYYVEIAEREHQGHEQYGDRPWLIVSADHIQGNFDIVVAVPRMKAKKQ